MTNQDVLNVLSNKMCEIHNQFDELLECCLLCHILICYKKDKINHWDEIVQQFQAQVRNYV